MRNVVVLPAPFGPRKPKISPSETSRSTPRTASTVFFSRPWRDVNDLRNPRVSIMREAYDAQVLLVKLDYSSRGHSSYPARSGRYGSPASIFLAVRSHQAISASARAIDSSHIHDT